MCSYMHEDADLQHVYEGTGNAHSPAACNGGVQLTIWGLKHGLCCEDVRAQRACVRPSLPATLAVTY